MPAWLRDGGTIVVVVAAAMAGVSTAEAQERWHEIARVSGHVVALDSRTISRTPEGYLRVWLRHRFQRSQAKPSGLRYRKMIVLMLLDCRGQRQRRIEVAYYDDAGNVISRSNKPGAWSITLGDMLSRRIMTETCRYANRRIGSPGRSSRDAEAPG